MERSNGQYFSMEFHRLATCFPVPCNRLAGWQHDYRIRHRLARQLVSIRGGKAVSIFGRSPFPFKGLGFLSYHYRTVPVFLAWNTCRPCQSVVTFQSVGNSQAMFFFLSMPASHSIKVLSLYLNLEPGRGL